MSRLSAAAPAGSGAALVVLAALVGAIVLASTPAGGGGRTLPPSLGDAVPYDGRSPRQPAADDQRVLVALPRPALGDRADAARMTADEQRAYVRSLKREATALRSALGARGVPLRKVVTFQRAWNGFAATVASDDLAALSSLGVRAQPVRRFYPAAGEPVPVPARLPAAPAVPGGGQAPVAVLDTGADVGVPALRGRTAAGYDAVARDGDPAPGADPRAPSRRESTGTALAGLLAAAGERVLPIRVAGFQPAAGPEVLGTSDQLLAGLERAVDPDGDGATSDHVLVALIGVNAPYAGFDASPEARAVRGAGRLGTLVVAPAGDEGRARAPHGTVGSPGGARAALAVGALAGGAAPPRVELTIGKDTAKGAVALGGAPPRAAKLRTAGPVSAADPAALLERGPRLQGRVAVVRAGANPVAQAAAAAGAGALAVVLAQPGRRPLAAMPAGRVAAPVLGVTGAAATAVLAAKAGATVRFAAVSAAVAAPVRNPAPSPFSSRGPSLAGLPKPDAMAPGAAAAPLPGGGTGVLGGTAVAAARVAIRAAHLGRERPGASVADLWAQLAPALAAQLPSPPEPPPVPLGPLRLVHGVSHVVGVRFTLGAFERGDPLGAGARIEPAERLELELLDAHGSVVRRLTPPGGAPELLPAEYAYTLPRRALDQLRAGAYRFRALARAPGQRRSTQGRSPPFTR